MKKLNVLIITEEDEFYLPLAVQHVINNCKHHIEAIFCLNNPTTASFSKTLKRFLSAFGFFPLIKHAARLIFVKFLNSFPVLNITGRFFSIKAIAKKNNIDYQQISDVNDKQIIKWIKDKKIDLIASISPTQIFKESLIDSTKFGCINIHSSLLPKYRGLYPVYWAMASGDKEIGVSIHYMDKSIDTGDIIIQDSFNVAGIRTMDEALRKAKLNGAKLLLEAIDCIASNTVKTKPLEDKYGSYYSFPNKESYKRFKKLGYSLW